MKNFKVTVDGVVYDVTVEETSNAGAASAPAAPVQKPAAKPAAAAPAAPAAPAGAKGGVSVKAPMPGSIMQVNVADGDKVKKGAVLCVLEAMKMENEIMAPQDGVVASVEVKKGDSVTTDALLVTMN